MSWEAVATGAGILSDVFGGNGSANTLARSDRAYREMWNQKNFLYQRRQNSKNFNEARRQFGALYDKSKREFDHATAIRVADAKSAGVHPLFALGAGTGTGASPVISIPGQAATSATGGAYPQGGDDRILRGVRGAAEFFATKKERKEIEKQRQADRERQNRRDRAELEVQQSIAEKNYAQAQLAASEASRSTARSLIKQDDSVGQGEITVKPDETRSSRKDNQAYGAATKPGLDRIVIGQYENGNPIYAVGSKDSSSIEEDVGAWIRYAKGKARRNARRRADSVIWKTERNLKKFKNQAQAMKYAKKRGWIK